MLRGVLFLLVVALIHHGSAHKCYQCKDCGNDISKATKITCQGDQQQCVSFAFSFPSPLGIEINGRDCAAVAENCNNHLDKVKDELRNQYPNIDTVQAVASCVFCKDDLCNSAVSFIKPSLFSLVGLIFLFKMY